MENGNVRVWDLERRRFSLPADLSIRERIEFSFYNWISWVCLYPIFRGVVTGQLIKKK
jgi:hypothetical protein